MKNSKNLVSVIVASYNHAQFLVERMESLLAQTYPNIEIIVIDDCSTDNSIEVLKRYENSLNVKIIQSRVNRGWVAVSNYGASIAKGDFIIFANCDDSCDNTMIEKLVQAVTRSNSISLAFCKSKLINESGRIFGDDFECRESEFKKLCSEDVIIKSEVIKDYLMKSCVVPNLSAAIIRKRDYLAVSGMSDIYKICADWDFFLRIVDGSDVAYVSAPLNNFRQHANTIRSSSKVISLYGEMAEVVLNHSCNLKSGWIQRAKYQFYAMYLVVPVLYKLPVKSYCTLSNIVVKVLKISPSALAFIPVAIFARCVDLFTHKGRLNENK